MTVAKNIEVSSTSTKSFEDAVQKGVAQVAETVKMYKALGLKSKK